MRFNNIKLLVIASAIAMILLILFQVKWMLHSKDLVEEQFTQRVSMALCNAVEEAGKQCKAPATSELTDTADNKAASTQEQLLEEFGLDEALTHSMSQYAIDLNYKSCIVDKNTASNSDTLYSCSVQQLADNDDLVLGVSFTDKQEYILDQMGYMTGTSILILLLICTTFFLTVRALVRQRRLNEINVNFFSNMSHEYRTPLTNIQLALSMIKKKNKGLEEDRFVDIIGKESNRLKQQVERMLQLTKMEEGEYQLVLQQINLQDLIQEVVAEMQLLIQRKQAKVHLELGNTKLLVKGDRLHLGNAFRNLIENALKYCDKAPEIRIRLLEEKGGVRLCFEDNGIGICKGDQSLIFDKFQRVGTGDLHRQKGFGLGLSYVKMVIELHKGMIKIISELNKGSQFTLFLPNNPGI